MKHYFYAAALICGLFCLSIYSPAGAQTDSNMPPRPIPPSKPASTEPEDENKDELDGGKIVLHLPAGINAWTIVQWQDEFGRWHDIQGWGGYPTWDAQNQEWAVEWWVDEENFSEGPFRWVGTADENNQKRLFVTASFILPERMGQIVDITLVE